MIDSIGGKHSAVNPWRLVRPCARSGALIVAVLAVLSGGKSYAQYPAIGSGLADTESPDPYTSLEGDHGDVMGPGDVVGPQPGPGTLHPEPEWEGMGADFGYSCPPRWYAQGDAFWISREHDSEFTLSQDFELPSFGFMQNYRLTIGHTRDCLDGWEATYVGGGRWRETSLLNGADLDSTIIPGPGFAAADFSAFNDAALHIQNHESEMHSFEVNRRWWGWDVFSVKTGARVIHLDEEYWFLSQQAGGDQGFLLVDTQNDLLLWQLGFDLMRPYGRLTTGAKFNGGVGISFNEGNALIVNDGDVKINTGDDSEEFGFLLETGLYAIYRATEHISLHVGYETWFFGELAVANEQIHGPIDVFFGGSFDETDELFVHGGRAGVEIVW